MSLPMPPENKYAQTRPLYFRRVWDAREMPPQQEIEGVLVITPTAGQRIVIYGRACVEDPEDFRAGWMLGEWFSRVCPEGELGMARWNEIQNIDAEEFSAAYERGWSEE